MYSMTTCGDTEALFGAPRWTKLRPIVVGASPLSRAIPGWLGVDAAPFHIALGFRLLLFIGCQLFIGHRSSVQMLIHLYMIGWVPLKCSITSQASRLFRSIELMYESFPKKNL
jgi:hypothetical protein